MNSLEQEQLVQDIVRNGRLISLADGDLMELNGYLLVSLDKRNHYPLNHVVAMIRYVLGEQRNLLYVRNPKTNQLEKIT